MQPQRPHQWQPVLVRFTYGCIRVREQAISQVQVLLADRLDLCVVKFARVCHVALIDFDRPELAGVPSPRQAKLPGAAMRPKQGTKSAELEPANKQLAGKFLGRNKPTCISAPIRKT